MITLFSFILLFGNSTEITAFSVETSDSITVCAEPGGGGTVPPPPNN